MRVADIMNKQVEFVTTETPVIDVSSLIFGRNINGVPVVDKLKLVGFITEKDILTKFFPTVGEYVEDPFREGNFEGMEKKVDEIFGLKAKQIMSKTPITVREDTPLLKAQSLMFLNKIGRLPVVNEDGELIGILSKSDIFRTIVGQKIPFGADEQFHDWLSRRFDLITDQEKRLSKEIPDLVNLFKKEKVQKILDVGCGTGVHAIALAKRGFQVVGIDRSKRMNFVAKEKTNKLPSSVKKRLQFIQSEYENLGDLLSDRFDAAMFMGSGLAHNSDPEHVLKEVNKVLAKKTVMVCQVANYEKVIKTNKRFYDFNIRKSHLSVEREQAFLRFFDPTEKGLLTQNVCVFARGEKRWSFKGMHAVSINPLNENRLELMFKKFKFNTKFYGGEEGYYYDFLFRKPFRPLQSDVLIAVAKR